MSGTVPDQPSDRLWSALGGDQRGESSLDFAHLRREPVHHLDEFAKTGGARHVASPSDNNNGLSQSFLLRAMLCNTSR
jgi:hypothetical protein